MLPDGGRICETTEPPWQDAGEGHRILCHIPLETLRTLAPVVQSGDDGIGTRTNADERGQNLTRK
jgi:peptide/nickel transport system ATP-binding protein